MSLPTALQTALSAALDKRRTRSTLRALSDNPAETPAHADFSSNDYLSLARSLALRAHFLALVSDSRNANVLGASASRLLDGNTAAHVALEHRLASFYRAESALLFNSGFDANVGFFSTVPQRGDVVVYDELVHASVHDGMRASRAREALVPFLHNDMRALEETLRGVVKRDADFLEGRKTVFVAVESLYSMDGDFCPLAELVPVVRDCLPAGNGCIVVDEAHSNGVYGPKGRGLVSALGLEDKIHVRLHTFGKAMAASGAVLLINPLVRSYLVNYARPLIYSTAMALYNVVAINASLDFLEKGDTEKLSARLAELTRYCVDSLQRLLQSHPRSGLSLPPASLQNPSPIIPLLCRTPRPLASYIQGQGYMVRAITQPTVPPGSERVRICVHAGNTKEEIDGLVDSVGSWLRNEAEIRSKL